MSFESQLGDIFDLDIWELKSQYKSLNHLQTDSKPTKPKEFISAIEQKQVSSEKLIYTNNIDSNKTINIFLANKPNVRFLKNIVDNLFFNSKVNVYKVQSLGLRNDHDEINLFEKDFIADNGNILSVESKKYILSKLHKYADFKLK
ncbi:hypothetical protein fh0823_05400 [Francisella halioticida]|uniref:Chloroquine resistance protein n=1 Tax=Francisella halioticida TaxID=549298 RepID=A0ABN5AVS1_9GAMM|nr:chloroquine resistance protein [Francisella halioticida]ASG68038.1 chloroquine resistance protein [Francisella halioticida]BCD90401.1 hypothetical protein fh0823_05400 [Francisella halioticida]